MSDPVEGVPVVNQPIPRVVLQNASEGGDEGETDVDNFNTGQSAESSSSHNDSPERPEVDMGSTNNNTSKKQKKNRLNQALTIRDHDIRDQLNPLVGSKKTLVQGLIDFALLSANVSQLLTTISLQVQDQNTERKANIILICISIFLQVVSGFLQIASNYIESRPISLAIDTGNSDTEVADEGASATQTKGYSRQRLLHNIEYVLLGNAFLITVFNIFITALSKGATEAGENPSNPVARINTTSL